MMIGQLLSTCDARYRNTHSNASCDDCSYNGFCTQNCGTCLHYIHYPKDVPVGAPPRKYDCPRMADFYVCKYVCCYTSEMVYALKGCKNLFRKDTIKVLSLGCGPCTDLLALDYLKTNGTYNFNNLEYLGVDLEEYAWGYIHNDIKSFSAKGIAENFCYKDVHTVIDILTKKKWVPDLVIFQYFLSTFHKQSGTSVVNKFLQAFAQYSDSRMISGSYIILNDINLDVSRDGGRDYFDTLFPQLRGCRCHIKGYFYNDRSASEKAPGGFHYANKVFESNTNVFQSKLTSLAQYHPFDTCGSAQMVIERI